MRVNRIDVLLARADMMLGDADEAALDRGANLALVGEELVQFAHAVPLGGRRWLLTGLRRGRRGTEPATEGATTESRFVLIEAASVAWFDVPMSAIGRELRLLATGVGDGGEPASAALLTRGVSVAPPAPAHLRAARNGAVVMLTWTRRSRLGWRWIDGVDAPLGEERETYLVSVTGEDGVERHFTTGEPRLTIADLPGRATIAVRQQGTIAASPASFLTIDGDE